MKKLLFLCLYLFQINSMANADQLTVVKTIGDLITDSGGSGVVPFYLGNGVFFVRDDNAYVAGRYIKSYSPDGDLIQTLPVWSNVGVFKKIRSDRAICADGSNIIVFNEKGLIERRIEVPGFNVNELSVVKFSDHEILFTIAKYINGQGGDVISYLVLGDLDSGNTKLLIKQPGFIDLAIKSDVLKLMNGHYFIFLIDSLIKGNFAASGYEFDLDGNIYHRTNNTLSGVGDLTEVSPNHILGYDVTVDLENSKVTSGGLIQQLPRALKGRRISDIINIRSGETCYATFVAIGGYVHTPAEGLLFCFSPNSQIPTFRFKYEITGAGKVYYDPDTDRIYLFDTALKTANTEQKIHVLDMTQKKEISSVSYDHPEIPANIVSNLLVGINSSVLKIAGGQYIFSTNAGYVMMMDQDGHILMDQHLSFEGDRNDQILLQMRLPNGSFVVPMFQNDKRVIQLMKLTP